jgi:hypothetical protein
LAAAGESRWLGRGGRGARSAFASPLLNLAPTEGRGPTVAHGGRLIELRDSGITGTARLCLSPDRRTIDISVTLDSPGDAAVGLRRLDLRGRDGSPRAENLLIVEVALCGRPSPGHSVRRRFSLDRRQAFPAFADTEELLSTGIRLPELRAESILGIAAEPAGKGDRGGQGQRDYLCERMLGEIDAAECSASAAAASRHVELATLYARRLRERLPGLAV